MVSFRDEAGHFYFRGNMSLTDELLRNILQQLVVVLSGAFCTSVVGGVIMWFDIRSLKKGMNACFDKVRDLEEKERQRCRS